METMAQTHERLLKRFCCTGLDLNHEYIGKPRLRRAKKYTKTAKKKLK